MDFLKVSSKSSPASVAGAIAGMVKDGVPVNMQCVGAGAVNQAIKAVAICPWLPHPHRRGHLLRADLLGRGDRRREPHGNPDCGLRPPHQCPGGRPNR